ncbi:MAG: polysaccharide deacetylase family protein [Hyphomicrobiaceae bacterium]
MITAVLRRAVLALFVSIWGMTAWVAHPALAQKAACESRKNVLGVSRTIEVDTRNGILLGNQQYKAIDFLKPGEVVLTFDDGPLRRKTLKVLNALEAHCTKATFFMVGRMAVSDPAMVREIDRRGHTVGTHTWSHKNLGRLSTARAKKEIELGISAVSAALGRPVAPFFRFPYLNDPKSMIDHLGRRNIATFSIDGDAFDYRTRSGAVVERQILRALRARGKGILLFHDIQTSTANGIARLLDKLHAKGYKVVHLVAKGKTTTLTAYDKIAKRSLAKIAKAIKERPLSTRSIVWPISQQTNFVAEPLINQGPYVPRRKKRKENPDLPWHDEDERRLDNARNSDQQAGTKKKRALKKRNRKKTRKQAPTTEPATRNSLANNPFWQN